MDPKQEHGASFTAVGTAAAASLSVTTSSTAAIVYVTDVSATSEGGTATLEIRSGAAAATTLFQVVINTNVPFAQQFKQPLACTGTALLRVVSAASGPKHGSMGGYII